MKLLPKMPWMPSRNNIEYYLCTCGKCGFRQKYVTGDFETIECGEPQDDVAVHVDKVPGVCPKCGGKMDKTHLKDVIKY